MSTPHNHWAQLDVSARVSNSPTMHTSALAARAGPGLPGLDIPRFLDDLIAPGDLPAKTREALRAAARAYAADPTATTFDKCLGFTGAPSERSWANRAAQAEMDRFLLAAWCTFDDAGSEWRRGHDLGAEIGAFKQAQWPAWRDLDAPPGDATPLRAALFRAAKAVAGALPKSWKGVRASVQRAQAAEGSSSILRDEM